MRVLVFGLFAFWLATVAAFAGQSQHLRVVDGDTLEVSGVKYRLHGIDAPEAGQTCAGAAGSTWPCGRAAIQKLVELVKGGQVTCENRGRDKYGRVLGVCTVNGLDINAAMVREGLAWSFTRYSRDYDEQESLARESLKGIWQAATQTAWDYRADRWVEATQEVPSGCAIKGNISRKHERIYHVPWSKDYNKTRINAKNGERWFCSEAEAIKAGWRAPVWGN